MKTNIKNSEKNNITVFRYKMEDLELKLNQEHGVLKNEVAVPLGKDLAKMQPSKPEANCEVDVYSGVINGAYSKMMMAAKKELHSEIESHHILADKVEADRKLLALEKSLENAERDYRLKKGELERCDNSLIKKAARYKWTRLLLMFLILVDTLVSGSALQALGYPLIISYVLGLAVGIGIFLVAEYLPLIISKGKTLWQQRLIALAVFSILFGIFYILGIFRTTTFSANTVFGNGAGPFYFACLNLFFSAVATLVVYFAGLSREEKNILDKYRIAQAEAEELKDEVAALKEEISEVHKKQGESELARKQIQIYARDIQELIQRLYEESQKTFYSTNCIHRSDGKVPKFFEYEIPMLPSFKTSLL